MLRNFSSVASGSARPASSTALNCPEKILIVRLGALGDIVHALPAQQQIHRRFPDCEIHWLVEPHYRGLLETVPVSIGSGPPTPSAGGAGPARRWIWSAWFRPCGGSDSTGAGLSGPDQVGDSGPVFRAPGGGWDSAGNDAASRRRPASIPTPSRPAETATSSI